MSKVKSLSLATLVVTASMLYVSSSYAIYTGARLCGPYGCTAQCAPEVQQGNIAATERVLAELAEGELKDAPEFTAMIPRIAALKQEEKLAVFFDTAGIEGDAELAEFVGAKDNRINSKHVQALSTSTNLTPEQSEMVLKKVAATLLGDRK